jgi:hypothetical protein
MSTDEKNLCAEQKSPEKFSEDSVCFELFNLEKIKIKIGIRINYI